MFSKLYGFFFFSRFSSVAVLRATDWLEIRGSIKSQKLTPNTKYGAYLILKISDRAYGLDSMPSELTLEMGNQQQQKRKKLVEGVLSEREDGWMEIELGEFFNGENYEVVKMSLMEVKGCHLKGGLVIEGIELRPKD